MIFGLTGTHEGMTDAQKVMVRSAFKVWDIKEFHHGDCIGADKESHDIVTIMGGVKRVIHPPSNPKRRAFCKGDVLLPEYPYIERDHHIVDAVQRMLGTPRGMNEELRSGTWATIRYAKKVGRRLTIIYPDGSREEFNEGATYF